MQAILSRLHGRQNRTLLGDVTHGVVLCGDFQKNHRFTKSKTLTLFLHSLPSIASCLVFPPPPLPCLTDVEDAGRSGGVPHPPRPHLRAAGRQHWGREAATFDGQVGRDNIELLEIVSPTRPRTMGCTNSTVPRAQPTHACTVPKNDICVDPRRTTSWRKHFLVFVLSLGCLRLCLLLTVSPSATQPCL